MFDGLMIYGNFYNDNNLLLKIKEGIEKKFNGLGMEWIYKKHCDKLKIEKINDFILDITYDFLPNYIKKMIDSPSECIIAESMKELYGNHYYYVEPDKKRWIEYKNNQTLKLLLPSCTIFELSCHVTFLRFLIMAHHFMVGKSR